MRQKHYWEIRIRELGGSDFRGGKKQFYDVEGKELPGAPHYKYYGVAKVGLTDTLHCTAPHCIESMHFSILFCVQFLLLLLLPVTFLLHDLIPLQMNW